MDEKEAIEEAIELILFQVSECYVYMVLSPSIHSYKHVQKNVKFVALGCLE